MKPIIILGPKHCGKTSVAEAFNGNCFDIDEEITKNSGSTPRELYKKGIEYFQEAEAIATKIIIDNDIDNKIISAGGGIIDNVKAVDLIKKKDTFKVYLDVSAKTAWQRISEKGELPPFLQTDNPEETHSALHNKRAQAYRELADIVINAENKTPHEIAKEIKEKLNII